MRGDKIDEKSLSRKYKTNVSRLIRAWKKGLSDMEIAASTGIDPATLNRIRGDIEMAHRRLRLARKKELDRLVYL
ncbi:hypothetical protein [Desulfofundulus salinus]|uniref:Helix-turn-helix domain-containing protein n=1 Tax=Desulfofundulus salinus TaxID=2419843 RepID=A0A494X445_9FIRM|nr:hypothetical protein [Desulfofundulus salinum]RKO67967.1 hypothetical protein D7024_14155 [Desulfofundulus salinum]